MRYPAARAINRSAWKRSRAAPMTARIDLSWSARVGTEAAVAAVGGGEGTAAGTETRGAAGDAAARASGRLGPFPMGRARVGRGSSLPNWVAAIADSLGGGND